MKQIKILLSVLTLFFSLQNINAQQFPDDVQYQSVVPPNTPALPNYGESVVDNSVPNPINITRVTEVQNYVDDNGVPQVWYPSHEYAKTQVWNIDQTKYKISSWKVYNAATYVEEQELSSMYPSYWSNTDPDVIWSFRENGDVKKYTVSTNTTQVVANINDLVGNNEDYDIVMLGPGEGNIDKNDHYVALVGKKPNGGDLDVIVFDLQTNQITQTITFAGAWDAAPDYIRSPRYIDWVSVSQSGDYVVVLWSNAWNESVGFYTDQNNIDHYGLEVYNRADMQYQRRIDDSAGHGDLGYAIDGDEVFVQFKTGEGGVYMYKLNGNGGEIIVNSSADFTASGHVSCRNINRPGWAYVTIPAATFSGQVVAVKLDTSGIVENFGHHFSSNTSYDQSPMAVASPNGDKICFHSDFGTGANDGDVAYSFFATLDSALSVEQQLETVNIYPNPANDFIRIEGVNNIKNISIYNELGQMLKTVDVDTINKTINISHLTQGIYFIRIVTEKGYLMKKLIKE